MRLPSINEIKKFHFDRVAPHLRKFSLQPKLTNVPYIFGSVIVLIILFGLFTYIHSYFYQTTDDAFIESHVVGISPKISNQVKEVLIDDNNEVKKGQLLVQIDPRDYDVALLQAKANYTKAQSEYDRTSSLMDSHAVSQSDMDTARNNLDVYSAQVQQAQLNLDYTRITAPFAGHITRKDVEPGSYVQTGQTICSVVSDNVWVIANFKETQLTYIHPGQTAYIRVDMYPGHVFKGHVESIQSGTGARFSLLPPENATGNYVKVVQRIPVKIVFDEPPEVIKMLSPGMSVQPEVYTGFH